MQKIYKPIQISNKITEILIGTCAECRAQDWLMAEKEVDQLLGIAPAS